jgi:hypothetical protein
MVKLVAWNINSMAIEKIGGMSAITLIRNKSSVSFFMFSSQNCINIASCSKAFINHYICG